MKKFNLKRVASLIYALAITAMAFLFFTNDFGLVDIRKTAVIIGAGIDLTESGVSVIAQVAVPQATENGGSIENVNVWGKRRLAYPINYETEGYYVLFNFTSAPSFPAELERVLNITDGVMRSVVTLRVSE